jgi:rhamnosyl/mannosyltransferase
MRVLHVFKDAFPPTFGGVEQHMWDVARSLRNEGFEFGVLTSSRSRRRIEERLDGVRFVRTPEYGRAFSTPLTPAWRRELRRDPDTLVHVHLPSPVGEAAVLTAGTGAPVVAGFYAEVSRNPTAARLYRPLQQRFLARAARIVVSSQTLADGAPALADHGDRIAVIPFGVDADEWPAAPERIAAIRREAGTPLALFLGRLVRYKGVDVLIEAMRRVDATLVIVGDGPQRDVLRRTVPAGARVRFVGNVTNAERSAYYQAADVFVLPSVSRAESFGIAMLEAMSFGTPAISTEVGTATSWVNLDGQTGCVVPPGDRDALAEALDGLLGDDQRRKQYAEAASLRARRAFSKQAMLDRLTDLYRAVYADSSASR